MTTHFGPQHEHVRALIARLEAMTPQEGRALVAAAWDAAWDAARAAAWGAACAAAGLVVRDLISTEHYDALTRTVRTVLGPIHPDDPPLTGDVR